MAFNPSSTIYLCAVDIDKSYQNQVYFESRNEQFEYFYSKRKHTFTDYYTTRRTTSSGSLISSVKVAKNIDVLKNSNYMMFQNANHGTKWFYCFIKEFVYINEATTEIIFETDVFQTWFLDCEILKSYVVREHAHSDTVGSNIAPEKFNIDDYVFEEAVVDSKLDEWGYLVGTSEPNFETTSTSAGHLMSGIFQGLYFFYYENTNDLCDFLAEFDKDVIQFISVIPKFCLGKCTIGATESDRANGQGFIYANDKPAEGHVEFTFNAETSTFNGYIPKNKKMFTYPYYSLIVTNHNGEEAQYKIEDFYYNTAPEIRDIIFNYRGDVSANPSVTLIPQMYQNVTNNYDCGISISGFPQCAYTTDTFKLWLAKNQFNVGIDVAKGLFNIGAGVFAASSTGGLATAVGGGMAINGANQIMGTISNVVSASKEPNKTHGGSAKNNLLTAMGLNKFKFYWKKLKQQHAKTIDYFFTMYGYQVNQLKYPNLNSRPFFNYIQTSNVNIKAKTGYSVPCDDMEILKNVFNNGVTLWKPASVVGDYNVDNSPT